MTPLAPWQVWWMNFDPIVGREQAGMRPAVVIGSALACQLPNHLAIVAPCTTRDRGLPFHPPIALERPTFVMCDQIKSVSTDRLLRPHPAALTADEISSVKMVLRQMIAVA